MSHTCSSATLFLYSLISSNVNMCARATTLRWTLQSSTHQLMATNAVVCTEVFQAIFQQMANLLGNDAAEVVGKEIKIMKVRQSSKFGRK
mmetsp:Transcript_16587/g.38103  ORF Transcript_16587/g.38103 Transcript_16587/m.38103 type:complete len:90 (+) Transcript_16587:1679-1948(+)